MSVVYLTLGFCPARIWAKSSARFLETAAFPVPHRRVFVGHHYPVHKERNRQELMEICRAGGWEWIEPERNLGLHGGQNWAVQQLGMTPDDVLIGVDPDTYMIQCGWDEALLRVMEDRRIGLSCLAHHATEIEISNKKAFHREDTINGIRVHRFTTPTMIGISSWRMDWVLRAGGFQEPYEWYGGIESHMWPLMMKNERQFVMLRDFAEDYRINAEQDPLYGAWKQAHIGGDKRNFDVWLRDLHPEAL